MHLARGETERAIGLLETPIAGLSVLVTGEMPDGERWSTLDGEVTAERVPQNVDRTRRP